MAKDEPAVDGAAQAEKDEQERWDNFVKNQEAAGYTVQGDGFHNCVVVELPDGPTYEDNPTT